jgi:hypothetical protein
VVVEMDLRRHRRLRSSKSGLLERGLACEASFIYRWLAKGGDQRIWRRARGMSLCRYNKLLAHRGPRFFRSTAKIVWLDG